MRWRTILHAGVSMALILVACAAPDPHAPQNDFARVLLATCLEQETESNKSPAEACEHGANITSLSPRDQLRCARRGCEVYYSPNACGSLASHISNGGHVDKSIPHWQELLKIASIACSEQARSNGSGYPNSGYECEHIASLYADIGDVESAKTMFGFACKKGSVEGCAGLSSYGIEYDESARAAADSRNKAESARVEQRNRDEARERQIEAQRDRERAQELRNQIAGQVAIEGERLSQQIQAQTEQYRSLTQPNTYVPTPTTPTRPGASPPTAPPTSGSSKSTAPTPSKPQAPVTGRSSPAPGQASCDLSVGCVDVVKVLPDASYCKTTHSGTTDYLPVYKNSCDKTVTCRLCPFWPDRSGGCQFWTFSPNEVVGGWASPFAWCDTQSETHVCFVGGREVQRCAQSP